MDPDALPRLSASSYLSGETVEAEEFGKAASSCSNFTCDRFSGSCPHFARLTTTCVPAWPSLQNTCALPLGCVFQPFSTVHEMNHSSNSEGPFRCSHCQSFVSPFFEWLEEGFKSRCNLCQRQSDVPNSFYGHINGFGTRNDKYERPELYSGTVDFIPPSDIVYSTGAPGMIFVIDCSYLSSTCGFLGAIVQVLRSQITTLPIETEVAFILFNEAIHFVKFELSRNGSPSLVSVADVDDPFIPDPSLCISPHLMFDQFTVFIDLIQKVASSANPNRPGSCPMAAVWSAVEVLAGREGASGGTVVLFQASPSKLGKPCSSELTKLCLSSNICIDLFACSDNIISVQLDDLSTVISDLAGEQYFLSSADVVTTLTRYLGKPRFYNCVIRVRSSKSIFIDSIDFGKRKGTDSVSLLRMTSDSILGTSFSITESINPGESVYLQLACLYTRADGARLIRVVNIAMKSSPQAVQVFKHADLEAVGYFLGNQALVMEKKQKSKKDFIADRLVAILHSYRVNCAVSSASGQLILPESLKVLPLMMLGFLKQIGVRERGAETRISADEYLFNHRRVRNWTVREASFACIVRILRVYPSSGGALDLIPATRDKVKPSGIYFFDLDHVGLFYIGRDVDPGVVDSFFGPTVSTRLQDPRRAPVLELNSWPQGVATPRYPIQLKCVLGSSTIGETKISNLLIEDRIGSESGYVDWLCLIHRLIQDKIDS